MTIQEIDAEIASQESEDVGWCGTLRFARLARLRRLRRNLLAEKHGHDSAERNMMAAAVERSNLIFVNLREI